MYKFNLIIKYEYLFADLRKLKIRKSHKRLGPQIANAFLTLTEGPQII
jgi:hypothetical protein